MLTGQKGQTGAQGKTHTETIMGSVRTPELIAEAPGIACLRGSDALRAGRGGHPDGHKGDVGEEAGADGEVSEHAERDGAIADDARRDRGVVAEARLEDPEDDLGEDKADDETDSARVGPGICRASVKRSISGTYT